VETVLQTILFDPQTSGGLLFAVDANQADAFETAFTDAEIPLWRIGEVVPGAGIDVSP
jgi:selenide, water dikinase